MPQLIQSDASRRKHIADRYAWDAAASHFNLASAETWIVVHSDCTEACLMNENRERIKLSVFPPFP